MKPLALVVGTILLYPAGCQHPESRIATPFEDGRPVVQPLSVATQPRSPTGLGSLRPSSPSPIRPVLPPPSPVRTKPRTAIRTIVAPRPLVFGAAGRWQGRRHESADLRWSPNGRYIAVRAERGTHRTGWRSVHRYVLTVYDGNTGRVVERFRQGCAHLFGRDGRSLFVSGGWEGNYSIAKYDLRSRRQIWKRTGFAHNPGSFTLSRDGRRLASASGCNVRQLPTTVHLLDAGTGARVVRVPIPLGDRDRADLSFGNRDRWLLAQPLLGHVSLIDTRSARLLVSCRAPSLRALCTDLDAAEIRGARLIARIHKRRNQGSVTEVWQLYPGRPRRLPGARPPVRYPRPRRAAAKRPKRLPPGVRRPQDAKWNATGTRVATYREHLHVWAVGPGSRFRRLTPRRTTVRQAALSPNGLYLATANRDHLTVWYPEYGRRVITLRGVDGHQDLAWRPNEILALGGDPDRGFRLVRWQNFLPGKPPATTHRQRIPNTGACAHHIKEPLQRFRWSLCNPKIAPGPRLQIRGAGDGDRLWWSEPPSRPTAPGWNRLATRRDGSWILLQDGTMTDGRSGRSAGAIPLPHESDWNTAKDAAFGPGSLLALSIDRSSSDRPSALVLIYNWRRKRLLRRWVGHWFTTTGWQGIDRGAGPLAWSPDGRWLATSSLAGEIALWSPDGQLRWRTTLPAAGSVEALFFAPSSRALFSRHADGTLRRWPIR